MTAPTRRTLGLRVTGVVQGVGFRPFVHRLATRYALDGWVRNANGSVEIAVEGESEALDRFCHALARETPPLARIAELRATPLDAHGLGAFRIHESDAPAAVPQPIPADVGTCAACEAELRDPADRRYRYPFVTCTDCGPRFSVIEDMPYDRARTSMREFVQCPRCRHEYESSIHRRYHAETNACPACGPRLALEDPQGRPLVQGSDDAITVAAGLLRAGMIVAVRGLGGFHLACDATSESAVGWLRERKRRDAKPLAVMVRSLEEARAVAILSDAEADWLERPERPIVVVRRLPGAPIAGGVSGELDTLGLMLPYSPLHRLLLDAAGMPLVMTSGNRSREPLVAALPHARAALGTIADVFLVHDREIVNPIDDSVLRVVDDAPVLMRRARGFAPLPVRLPIATPMPLVAVGAHLKNTFTLAVGRDAYPSQHIGDLETLETAERWEETLGRYERLLSITPLVGVRDLHPDYLSTRLAERLPVERLETVQHHHAHVAAVMAEHGVTAPVVGVALDGTGYGDDGCIWGAEFLVCTLGHYRRAGHLRYAPLPGGDAAVRAPWRTLLGYHSLAPEAFEGVRPPVEVVSPRELQLAREQAARGLNAPLASSMGRLFDAAAALLGVCTVARYDGQAAMRLEALAGRRRTTLRLPFAPAMDAEGMWVLDPIPLLSTLAERQRRGGDLPSLAAAFHDAVSNGVVRLAARIAEDEGLTHVALGGGVFQNARLLHDVRAGLEGSGFRVLVARELPPNDGGISYGQAAVAAARLAGVG